MFIHLRTKATAPFVLSLVLFALSACGRRQPSEPAEAAPAASPSATAALKIAFVYSGPVGDGGWTYAHDQARKTIEAELGDRIQTSYVENVPEGAAAEKVFRELAQQGNRIIFGTSYGYAEAMLKVAQEFPDVKFEHATGDRTAANLAVYEARTYEGAYLAGVLAGKVSKTGRLGFVASVPIPEVIRNINAFTLGARSVNPDASTRVAWVMQWIDPAKERAGALALIAQGADVLMQNTDSPAVLQTAQEKGVRAFGWDSDMTRYGADAHLGSATIDWAPYYKKVVTDVMAGRWKPEAVWWGARQNVIRLASPNPALARDLILSVGETTHALKSGTLQPFQGPISDRNGNQLVAAGAALDDAHLKTMAVFVQGVIGEIPR
jgi:simple sugar transport system substrate-binding protein